VEAGTELDGRYILEERLGSGGMGDLWRGTDRELRREVAVKLMRFAVPELARRFEREAEIAAKLQHPGITVVYDRGWHADQPFIVMELLLGQDLARLVEENQAGLAVDYAVQLTIQAAEALQAAHNHHVVHRDLKPANLFLQQNGMLKICDFGIARAADMTTSLTSTGTVIGTPLYMAPEQWQGEQADERSDLYSLGCVLYELLTGQPPFLGDLQSKVMFKHLYVLPDSPRESGGRIFPHNLISSSWICSLRIPPVGRPAPPTSWRYSRGSRSPLRE